MTEENKYADMLDMPHHVSETRPQMTRENRAAQFAPFAALVGYDADIAEMERWTETASLLSADAQELLDTKLREAAERISTNPLVELTYFEQDAKKAGGAYRTEKTKLHRIEPERGVIVLSDRRELQIADIIDIEIVE